MPLKMSLWTVFYLKSMKKNRLPVKPLKLGISYKPPGGKCVIFDGTSCMVASDKIILINTGIYICFFFVMLLLNAIGFSEILQLVVCQCILTDVTGNLLPDEKYSFPFEQVSDFSGGIAL
jgi:hypothetical protein